MRYYWPIALIYLLMMHIILPNYGGSGLELPFNSLTWLLLLIFVWLGLERIATSQSVDISQSTLALACAALTSITVINPLTSNIWPGAVAALWLGVIVMLLVDPKDEGVVIPLILWLLAFSTLIEACLGMLNNIGIVPSFGSYSVNAGRIIGVVLATEETTLKSLRPVGVFQQPNVLASFLTTGLAACGIILATKSPSSAPPHQIPRLTLSAALLLRFLLHSVLSLTIMSCTAVLVITASRTGWIGLIFVLAMIAISLRNHHRRLLRWLVPAVIGLLIGGLMLISSPTNQERAEHKSNLESARTELYPQVMRMIVDKPLLGYGGGNFEKAYVTHAAGQHATDPTLPPAMSGFDHPHNELLFWWAEGGIAPVIGILGFMLWLLWCISHMSNKNRWLALALIAPLLLHNLLEYPFRHSAPHWLSFLLIVYIIDRWAGTPTFSLPIRRTIWVVRIFGLALLLIGSTVLINSLIGNWALWKATSDPKNHLSYLTYAAAPGPLNERYQSIVNEVLFKQGLKNNDRAALQHVNAWAFAEVAARPRADLYNALIKTSVKLGNIDRANRAIAEMNYYFPQIDHSGLELQTDTEMNSDISNTDKAHVMTD